MKAHYSPQVDPHVYLDGKAGCLSPDDWIDLAIAAFDQAGFSTRDQSLLRDEAYRLMDQWPVSGSYKTLAGGLKPKPVQA